ncbi:MAG: c-type cytochrome [Hyphomicrobium sp.]|nr:c-type cytochrome [Hyphomicrobium sp.]
MKPFSKVGFASVALVVAGTFSAPALAQSGERVLGEQIAARECVGCHGVGRAKGVTIQGAYVPSFSEIANRPNQSRERLQSFLTIPRHPMTSPPLGDRELRQLAEYILSLRE